MQKNIDFCTYASPGRNVLEIHHDGHTRWECAQSETVRTPPFETSSPMTSEVPHNNPTTRTLQAHLLLNDQVCCRHFQASKGLFSPVEPPLLACF